jgi:hypothetical protein
LTQHAFLLLIPWVEVARLSFHADLTWDFAVLGICTLSIVLACFFTCSAIAVCAMDSASGRRLRERLQAVPCTKTLRCRAWLPLALMPACAVVWWCSSMIVIMAMRQMIICAIATSTKASVLEAAGSTCRAVLQSEEPLRG